MIKDRIEKIIRDDGMTSSKFADEIGVQRSSISHILSGRNNPSLELVQKILYRYRNINPEWLINGSGEAYKNAIRQPNIFENEIEKEIKEEPDVPYGNPKQEKVQSGNHVDEIIKPDENRDQSNVKTIDKIVVFYTDNTFKEFLPQ